MEVEIRNQVYFRNNGTGHGRIVDPEVDIEWNDILLSYKSLLPTRGSCLVPLILKEESEEIPHQKDVTG